MFDNTIKFKYPWRPYQDRVLKEADSYSKDGKVNIVAAPGSGKTILGLELARRLGNPVIIFAPTVTIKKQWVTKFLASFTDFQEVPDWISTDIYNLKFFNVVTYQALHYAYKRKKVKEELEDTDDIIEDIEENATDKDIKSYDIINELKSKNVTTLVLDEAHHLKSEWWKSLNEVVEALGTIKLISLTATPPYDAEPNIWSNYESLCGKIDCEISVPELVKAKNLCPHQDYIYFNFPTAEEIEKIKDYNTKLNEIVAQIKNDNRFIDAIYNHKFIKEPYENSELILENPEYYSSMLIFLNASNKTIESRNVKVLGHNNKIPKLDLQWLEILLKNVFIDDRKSYELYEDMLCEYETKLNKIGAIEKKKISIVDNQNIQKYFVNSLGKLNSISEIVGIEWKNLNKEMRMVILTDYIRREYETTEEIEIDKIGVLPIFKVLKQRYLELNIAILTGRLFVIPKSKCENLYQLCNNKKLSVDKIKFNPFVMNEDYVEVVMPETMRNDVMNCISKLFEMGEINLIVGTKSLLGEGWDEPAINSLILATFVGSYMLSNQMRGRAIRVNSNPNKTANIWHLVCVLDSLGEESDIENTDLNLLKRRFESFTGIGYEDSYVSSGLDRLGCFNGPYTSDKIQEFNNLMRENSNNRQKMFQNWQNAVENKSDNMQMTEEIELESVEAFTSDWLVSSNYIKVIVLSIIMLIVLVIGIIPRIITVIIECGLIGYIVAKTKKIRRMSNSAETVHVIAEVLLEMLTKTKNIKTPISRLKIKNNNEGGKVSVWLEGASLQESNTFITSLSEIFSKTENQRYIISSRKNNLTRYYNIPKIFSNNKENASLFVQIWNKKIGEVKLIYTKSVEGRKKLIQAREQNLDLKDKIKRKQKLVDWK